MFAKFRPEIVIQITHLFIFQYPTPSTQSLQRLQSQILRIQDLILSLKILIFRLDLMNSGTLRLDSFPISVLTGQMNFSISLLYVKISFINDGQRSIFTLYISIVNISMRKCQFYPVSAVLQMYYSIHCILISKLFHEHNLFSYSFFWNKTSTPKGSMKTAIQ